MSARRLPRVFARTRAPPLADLGQAAENDEAATTPRPPPRLQRGAPTRGAAASVHSTWPTTTAASPSSRSEFRRVPDDPARPPDKPRSPCRASCGGRLFLTGEEVDRRTTVTPLRPVPPLPGRVGPRRHRAVRTLQPAQPRRRGFVRRAGRRPPLAREVGMVDLGVNWYPERWVKSTCVAARDVRLPGPRQ